MSLGFKNRSLLKSPRVSLLMIFGVAGVLVVLAAFQYRWITQVSEAEQRRMKDNLDIAVQRFAQDFDGEFMRLMFGRRPDPGSLYSNDPTLTLLARHHDQWISTSKYPALLADLYAVKAKVPGEIELFRFDSDMQRLETVDWPAEFSELRDTLTAESLGRGPETPGVRGPEGIRLEQIPAFVLRLPRFVRPPEPFGRGPWPAGEAGPFSRRPFEFGQARGGPQRGPREFDGRDRGRDDFGSPRGGPRGFGPPPGGPPSPPPDPSADFGDSRRPFGDGAGRAPDARGPGPPQRLLFQDGWEILRLDGKFFRETFLRDLVQRHFAKQGNFDYDILIVQASNNSVVFRSSPNLMLSDFGTVDARVGLLGGEPGRPPREPFAESRPAGLQSSNSGRGWQLYAKHHSGSLQSYANQFRLRNLAISFGVFTILMIGIVFTFISSEKVRSIGKMQLEFAAGLSHELRTPLAVIRSAGYNLAAGNIAGKDEVVKYGKVLQEQGLRLSDMVEQALLFAQTQSGRNRYERNPADVASVVEKAIGACRSVLPKYSSEIIAEVADDLPLALTDANALTHCLQNLLMNALKYGPPSGRIVVTARSAAAKDAPEIEIAVRDQGPGIDPADRPHIFDPFFRGKNTSGVSGSGLGLYMVKSIIESLGGRVSVVALQPKGSEFALYVPALPLESTQES